MACDMKSLTWRSRTSAEKKSGAHHLNSIPKELLKARTQPFEFTFSRKTTF